MGASPERARMLWKPSEESFHARLWIALRFQSLQARWMITSWPREMRSVPIVSADSIASPAGLSVIDRTSIRGSSTSSRATSRARRARVSVISPRLVTSSAAMMKRSVSVRRWRRDGRELCGCRGKAGVLGERVVTAEHDPVCVAMASGEHGRVGPLPVHEGSHVDLEAEPIADDLEDRAVEPVDDRALELARDLAHLVGRDARAHERLVRAVADAHELVGREVVVEVAGVGEEHLALQ